MKKFHFLTALVSLISLTVSLLVASAMPGPSNGMNPPPVLVPQFEHSGAVTGIVLSNNGETALSWSSDGNAIVWDTRTATIRLILPFGGSVGTVPVLSPDGQRVAMVSNKGVEIWSVTDPVWTRQFVLNSINGSTLAFSPDSAVIAAASSGGPLQICDIATGKFRSTAENEDGAGGICFSADGSMVAVARTGHVDVWNTKSLRRIASITGLDYPPTHLTFGADGKVLAMMICQTSAIDMRSFPDGKRMALIALHGCTSAAFSPNGLLVATTEIPRRRYGLTQLWNAHSGQLLSEFKDTAPALQVAFRKDGKTIAIVNQNGRIRFADIHTGRITRDVRFPAWPSATALSPDGSVAAWGTWRGDVGFVQVETATAPVVSRGTGDQTLDCIPSPNGNYLACYRPPSHSLLVWDLRLAHLCTVIKGAGQPIAFSPDGNLLAFRLRPNSAEIWDLHLNQRRCTLKNSRNSLSAIAFSTNSHLLATTSNDGYLQLWNTQNGALQRTFRIDGRLTSVVFSPDGDHLAICFATNTRGKPTLVVREYLIRTGTQTRQLTGMTGWYGNLCYADSGKILIGWSQGSRVMIWDRSGATPHRLALPYVVSIQTAPRGPLAMAQNGAEAILFNAHSGQILGTYRGSQGLFDKTGRWVALRNNGDSGLKIIDTTTAKVVPDSKTIKPSFLPQSRTTFALHKGGLAVMDLLTGKIRVTIFAPVVEGASPWMIITPNNFFTGSNDLSHYFRWYYNHRIVPFGQFDAIYRRPLEVQKALK